ncbi:unnamed protein product [Aureobasidium mustum]|uniref:chitinase n=1 Tax=Aureobasidium mustum TaxID=2773714 RepID=A0A9N8PM98_9PEZI|nr:unnamed protein product [Aureobasidium mustum]
MQLPTKLIAGLLLLNSPALVVANSELPRGNSPDLSWREKIVFGVGHQNHNEAPPIPILNYEPGLNDSTTALRPRDSTIPSLNRRDGALHCDTAPCVDGSCCGKDGICGYGPDYCGDGCTSQCNATAMCGEFSEDADMPCGMNLCCSSSGWCGTTEVFCHNADPFHQTLPCQAGYGSCSISTAPSCSTNGGSSNGRTVGYYQSWNVRNRKCDTKTPSQLNTKGFTHLFYSFAFIDPNSFDVVPAHDDDEEQMREFTALSSDGKLQTWIAIGGFDFSDKGTPTHTTWSDMVSTKANRAKFIASLEAYMKEYGFQGVDLDWEYPGDPDRGGRKLADTRNLSLLVREMRAAYGTRFGISVTLAPDYWYLRWFDAKAMEPNVDFFGFMAYDLHGSWDSDVHTLGKIVRGQADIREIRNDTAPLWFDGLDPAKINFVTPASVPVKPASSHSSEIKNIAKSKGIHPTYLSGAMMKELTWDDQWIGYDDEETFAAKKEFANSMCFGGTMPPHKGLDNGGTSKGLLPFAEFVNCKPDQQDQIEQAWKDVQLLVEKPSQFNLDRRSFLGIGCKGICKAGPTETLIWGKNIASRVDDIKFIRKIYSNIEKLGSSVHFDNKIRIGCDVDYRDEADENASCKTNSGKGGFAFSKGEKTNFKDGTIVLCPIFFNRDTIKELTTELDGNPKYQDLATKRLGKGTLLLHELTHLDSISGGGDDHIEDKDWNKEGGLKKALVYGPKEVEKLARKKPQWTRTNADSYAIYASILYFNERYGGVKHNELRGDDDDGDDDDDTEETKPDPPTKALNIIRENKEDFWVGERPTRFESNWLFYSVPFGTASECSDNPIPVSVVGIANTDRPDLPVDPPGGTFAVETQDGKCEYKNDGTGNAGALWCSGTMHSCKYHDNRDKASRCTNLMKSQDWLYIQHVPVVASLLHSLVSFAPPTQCKTFCLHQLHSPAYSNHGMSNYTTILSRKQRWGFAIYRTDYTSEADWTKFLAMFNTWPLHGFPGPQLENGRLARAWQQHYWMNEQSQFDGATTQQLRQHFHVWSASQDFGGQRVWPESYVFLVVDKDVLDNIRSQNAELDFMPRDEAPYVKVIDKDQPDEGEEYPGWMKLHMVDLLDVYMGGLNFETMRGLRPRFSDWYKGRLLEEDTYLEEDEESESSLDWGSESEGDENTSES